MTAQVFTSDNNIQDELDQNEKIQELEEQIKEILEEIGQLDSIPVTIGCNISWTASRNILIRNHIDQTVATLVYYVSLLLDRSFSSSSSTS